MDYEYNPLHPSDSDIKRTEQWIDSAIPSPTAATFGTQLGCFFEEFAEVLSVLEANDSVLQFQLSILKHHMNEVAESIKGKSNIIYIKDELEFVDGLCDVIVTATNSGRVRGHNMSGALGETNRSNFSKFDSEGNPIFNEKGKIMKGENYFRPNLVPYLNPEHYDPK